MKKNGTEDLELRLAQPSDAKAAAPIFYQSADQILDYLYRTKKHAPTEFIEYAFARKDNFLSYDLNVLCLNDSQEIVGIGASFTRQRFIIRTLNTGLLTLKFFGIFSGTWIIIKSLLIEKIIPPPASGELYLANLCVIPQYRSKGVMSKMFTWWIEQLPKLGVNKISLDVRVDNLRAKALYERWGLTVQYQSNFIGPKLGGNICSSLRMVKDCS